MNGELLRVWRCTGAKLSGFEEQKGHIKGNILVVNDKLSRVWTRDEHETNY